MPILDFLQKNNTLGRRSNFRNLRALIEQISQAMAPTERKCEIVIVDDNSQDWTEQNVAKLIQEGFVAQLITRVHERGLSSAVIEGLCHG